MEGGRDKTRLGSERQWSDAPKLEELSAGVGYNSPQLKCFYCDTQHEDQTRSLNPWPGPSDLTSVA